jgi:hypothetical protein
MMKSVDMRTMLAGLTIALVAGLSASTPLNPLPPIVDDVESTTFSAEIVHNYLWKCPECTPAEQYVLTELQTQTQITDKNALATLMGNIKQESKFIPNICEGGARVSYENCLSGGYGLIQWTSIGRYRGLGRFCAKYICDPSSLEGQTRWMINEPIFQRNLPVFEGSGQSISYYMKPAYRWLGWGIKGNREVYAWDYLEKITSA